MGLDYIRRTYERWGEEDPLYAVLSRRGMEGGRWDPESFFATGRDEIDGVMAYLAGLDGVELRTGRALDFGCGVGRLTRALARHFDRVTGVDISSSMVERARAFLERDDLGPAGGRGGDGSGGADGTGGRGDAEDVDDAASPANRVDFVVNTADDLSLFDDDAFDLVYSNITLQHIPPRFVRRYVADFFRVLRPGGVALFQMRNGPRVRPGSLRHWLYRLNREHLRHLFQKIAGKPPYEIHYMARSQVEELVGESGGRLVDVVDVSRGKGKGFRYCAVAE